MKTPAEKPPNDYDESEFDYAPPGCPLCGADWAPADTDGTYVMEIRHEDDCELLQDLREDDS